MTEEFEEDLGLRAQRMSSKLCDLTATTPCAFSAILSAQWPGEKFTASVRTLLLLSELIKSNITGYMNCCSKLTIFGALSSLYRLQTRWKARKLRRDIPVVPPNAYSRQRQPRL